MARSTRLIQVPAARGESANGSWKQIAGSMGAMVPDGAGPPAEKFEAPVADDATWARTVAARESAEGFMPDRMPASILPGPVTYQPAPPPPPVCEAISDLSGLPDKFTLVVERKPDDWWKVTAPDHHAGLYIAVKSLDLALRDAPGSLALLLRLDGPAPVTKRGRKAK